MCKLFLFVIHLSLTNSYIGIIKCLKRQLMFCLKYIGKVYMTLVNKGLDTTGKNGK